LSEPRRREGLKQGRGVLQDGCKEWDRKSHGVNSRGGRVSQARITQCPGYPILGAGLNEDLQGSETR